MNMNQYHKILFSILLIVSLLINIFWGWYMYPVWFPKEINIPNKLQINNFCKTQNYDSGWLSSSSCDVNEVMCYKKIFDMAKFTCVVWK